MVCLEVIFPLHVVRWASYNFPALDVAVDVGCRVVFFTGRPISQAEDRDTMTENYKASEAHRPHCDTRFKVVAVSPKPENDNQLTAPDD